MPVLYKIMQNKKNIAFSKLLDENSTEQEIYLVWLNCANMRLESWNFEIVYGTENSCWNGISGILRILPWD